MAFQSLYRKYRPQQFDEFVGQEHVTAAIMHAVREDRVGHAYLFSGPRGTGKTTAARLLAKAVNCLALRDDGGPCGACENCVSIASGHFSDLVELDAASNNGVDAIRDLVERVSLGLGATAKRKVYLIDEVHMLTAAASNALLKTLEEPPSHVVFVLATTNPEKVLPTIRSRTQHFEFTLYSLDELTTHLAAVLEHESVEFEPEALPVIAHAASGSMRDALSLLDQALVQADGPLTAELVQRVFGGTPFDVRAAVLDAVAAEDPAGALIALDSLLDGGHEPRRVAEDLLRALRDAFLLVAGRGRVGVDGPDDEQARLTAIGEALGVVALVRALETLGQAVVDMRGTDAADPRLVLEVALVRLARRDAGPPLQALAERVDRLEEALPRGALPTSPGAAASPSPSTDGPARGPKPTLGALRRQRQGGGAPPDPVAVTVPDGPAPATAEPDAGAGATFTVDDAIVAWEQVLAALPRAIRSAVQEAQPLEVDGNVITFGVSRRQIDNVKPRFQREAQTIREEFIVHLGAPPRFKFTVHDFVSPSDPTTATEPADAARPKRRRPQAEAPPAPPEDAPPEDAAPEDEIDLVDPADIVDAPIGAGAGVDSITRVQDALGATVVEVVDVVEEQPRT